MRNNLHLREDSGIAGIDAQSVHGQEIVICGHNAIYAAVSHCGQMQGVAGEKSSSPCNPELLV